MGTGCPARSVLLTLTWWCVFKTDIDSLAFITLRHWTMARYNVSSSILHEQIFCLLLGVFCLSVFIKTLTWCVYVPVFSCLANWSFNYFMSRIFLSCTLVRQLHVLHLQVLHFQRPQTKGGSCVRHFWSAHPQCAAEMSISEPSASASLAQWAHFEHLSAT